MRSGLLTAIFVPSPELEALRDLVRAREDARLDRMRARHRLSTFVLRHDRRMPTTCWGVTRRAWLGRQAFALPGQQQAFDDYLFAVTLGSTARRRAATRTATGTAAATSTRRSPRDRPRRGRLCRGADPGGGRPRLDTAPGARLGVDAPAAPPGRRGQSSSRKPIFNVTW